MKATLHDEGILTLLLCFVKGKYVIYIYNNIDITLPSTFYDRNERWKYVYLYLPHKFNKSRRGLRKEILHIHC